mgnify:CR=1 FL=1
MPRYKVKAEMITDLFIVVEADDEEEALEIADEIDGGGDEGWAPPCRTDSVLLERLRIYQKGDDPRSKAKQFPIVGCVSQHVAHCRPISENRSKVQQVAARLPLFRDRRGQDHTDNDET